MDKYTLIKKIDEGAKLTNEEKSAILELLRTQKKYGLVWEDKPEDVEERLRDELPVLTEVKDRAIISDDKDAPNHILIEGDNLEALTTLSYTHAGKIDVIYIDPPYNTGNKDFKYNDKFVDKDDAYKHSKWLSFMYKRLQIAKQLLSEKGIIFISIDDYEQAQLKLLCDEVFGNKKFINSFIWQRNSSAKTEKGKFTVNTEYVLLYAKTDTYVLNNAYKPLSNSTKAMYSKDDHDGRGPYRLYPLQKPSSPGPETTYDYIDNTGKIWICPPKGWRMKYSKLKALENEGRLCLENESLSEKAYWNERESEGKRIDTLWNDLPQNTAGSGELESVMGEANTFDNPKPTGLISRCLEISHKEAIVLDFFAGSGTTMHATMQLNAEGGGHRQCILVTNNENNICEEVTYERNKRVIQGYTTPKGEAVAGLKANNLRYYKTDFVSREHTSKAMRQLVSLATDMLCIKEDLYKEACVFGNQKTHKGLFRYFADGDKKMLVVYREEVIEELAKEICNMNLDSPIKVYVFSPSEDPWEGLFEDVAEKVELCALPQAIYNAYRCALPKKRDKVVSSGMEEGTEQVNDK